MFHLQFFFRIFQSECYFSSSASLCRVHVVVIKTATIIWVLLWLFLKPKFISIYVCRCRSRKENLQLSSEYNKLQESYRQLEELKDRLQDKESTWMSNLTDSQKQNESSKQEVRLASDSDSVFYRQQVLRMLRGRLDAQVIELHAQRLTGTPSFFWWCCTLPPAHLLGFWILFDWKLSLFC